MIILILSAAAAERRRPGKVEIMKKVAAILIALALLTGSAFAGGLGLYPIAGRVTAINRELDIFTITDGAGRTWFIDGAEDYSLGDLVACILCDNGTETATDDYILSACYGGDF